MKKRGLGLKWQILLLFTAVAVLLVAGFLLMYGVLLNNVLLRSMKNSVKSAYEQIRELYENGETSEEELARAIRVSRENAGLSIAIEGAHDWDFLVITQDFISETDRLYLTERLQENFINPEQTGVTILEENADYTLQEVALSASGTRFYECYGYLNDQDGNRKKFIISMPLEPLLRSSRETMPFLLFGGLLILILGLVMSYVVSVRISKPVSRLSELSKRLTGLDFSARYTGKKQDEIGELGRNMNELAEKLAETIEELKTANEQLKKDIEEKEHVDEMRRDFISNVSHELKTPIALIQGYAEGIGEMRDDPESFAYYCDVIRDEADKMNRMVRKLMTLNQLEFGSAEMNVEPFSVTELIESIVQSSEKAVKEKNAHVTIGGEKDLIVRGDAFEIEEVLRNYYTNALNHLDGQRLIRIDAEKCGDKARISVFNTGEPIPETELDKVWIKFYKVDKARTRSYGGSGIGLSIVKAIMDAHHERYGVYNTEEGVTFWFELSLEAACQD